MNIEYIRTNQLIPYEKNAKIHSSDQITQIANSLKEFGWQQPIVIDNKNVVIIGHGRLEAAKSLSMEKVPVVRADDLTPEQVKALRLADNKLNESSWDFDLLEQELDDIFNLDMSDFGFELRNDQEIKPGKEVDIEEFSDNEFDCECPRCGFRFQMRK